MLRTIDRQTGEITDLQALSESEKADLARCESDIQQGLYQAWRALREIHHKRLYREYGSFETYCDEKWGISRRRGYQLIDAANLIDELCTVGSQIEIPNERVARALLGVPSADRLPVLLDAQVASGGKLDSGWIQDAAKIRASTRATDGYVDDGDGGMTEGHAAISDERHERMLRQRQHVHDSERAKAEGRGLRLLYEGGATYHSHNKLTSTLTTLLPRADVVLFDEAKPGKRLWIVVYEIPDEVTQ